MERDAVLDPRFRGGEVFINEGLQNAGIKGQLPLEPARFETATDAGIDQGAVARLVVEADFSGYVGRRISVGHRREQIVASARRAQKVVAWSTILRSLV